MTKDIKLSNIKGLLILLVVFGHLISPYRKSFIELYLLIYSFHMPLFILVSGYFAKKASFKKVLNFILLYLIFQPLCRSFIIILDPERTFRFKYEIPYFHLWYLVSIIAWYLMAIGVKSTPLKNVNKVVFIIGCFIVGILSKFFTEPVVDLIKNYDSDFYSYTLSYQRTLSFLPFFFLGFYLSEEAMHRIYHSLKAKREVTLATVTSIFFYFIFADSTNKVKILKGSYGAYQMKGAILHTSIDILVGYIIALAMCYVLLNAITDKKCFLTKWGDHSLPIFLFHSFFVMYIKRLTFLEHMNAGLLLIIMLMASFFIVLVLGSDIFVKRTYYLWHPIDVYKIIGKKRMPVI